MLDLHHHLMRNTLACTYMYIACCTSVINTCREALLQAIKAKATLESTITLCRIMASFSTLSEYSSIDS